MARFAPPGGQSCQDYLADFVQGQTGYIQDPVGGTILLSAFSDSFAGFYHALRILHIQSWKRSVSVVYSQSYADA